ncbi:hypothetical protein VTL71DRAFT_9188 [Oculimacula yallundae]|uniref:Uncharacterized protein n=1 Tax=Oculimacula yallundae TaxID=86028 RepID=A0ABR4BSA8_9HELO
MVCRRIFCLLYGGLHDKALAACFARIFSSSLILTFYQASSRKSKDSKSKSKSGDSKRASNKKTYVIIQSWSCCSCGRASYMSVSKVISALLPVFSNCSCGFHCSLAIMAYSTQFRQHAFLWKTEFNNRQHGTYESEDLKMTHDPETILENGRKAYIFHTPNPSTEHVIHRFIDHQCGHDIHRYLYRKLQLAEFLTSADLTALKTQSGPSQLKFKVLIDDRNNETGVGNPGNRRTFLGPLTASQLYHQLSLNNSKRLALTGSPDAERRLIYITDLDDLCVLALAATASNKQCGFLRDFVYRHLTRQSHLGVHIPSIGWPIFCLEFHLPYRAWRPRGLVETENHKSRATEGLPPLRRSEEVIYLGQTTSEAFIHEAEVSVMLIGLDNWYWTAYCFVDLYFQDDEHPEQVHRLAEAEPQMDFHSGGKFDLNMPKWDPRHYFLQTLSHRIEQVKQEWINASSQLFRDIDPRIYAFTRGEDDSNGEPELDITQRPGFIWAIRVLRQFTHEIAQTTRAWDTFKEGEIRYFNAPNSEDLANSLWGTLLAVIDKNITELKDLHSSLLHRTDLFENMTNSIVTHAAHAETTTTRRQTQFIQALTVITILYLPPSLASTIFSMSDSIFAHPEFSDWLYTLLGLFFATIILVLAVLGLNHPPILMWLGNSWKLFLQTSFQIVHLLGNVKRGAWLDRRPQEDTEDVELDELEEDDSGQTGQV